MYIYKNGMLCKHFKGNSLLEKNIYEIIDLNVDGKSIDSNTIIYTGEGVLETATDLVIYANIFQENKLFAREYSDISSDLSLEKQKRFNQDIRVQPLTDEEIKIVNDPDFIKEKLNVIAKKYINK